MSNKFLFIGLDGCTYDVLDPLMAEGRMPRLQALIQNGARASLETTVPPITPTAWVSMSTGTNPGKHSIFEFLLRRGDQMDVPINSTLRDSPAVWDILSDLGKQVMVTNMPVTYPPKPLNGLMVSDFLTPLGKTDYTYPAELREELESRFGPYRLYITEVYTRGRVEQVLDQLYDELEYKTKVGCYLMQHKPWDFYFTHIWSTDRCQHELWHIMDPTHPMSDQAEVAKYRDKVLKFWEKVDESVGRLVDAAGPNATIMMGSDHGFGPITKFLCFNVWMIEEGLIQLKPGVLTALKKLFFKLGLTPEMGYRVSMAVGLAKLRLALGVTNRSSVQKLINKIMLSLADVDWSRTKAYSKGNYGQIFINLKGREPHGWVNPGAEYEAACAEVIRKLRSLKHPETGADLIGPIWRAEEIYSGPHVKDAPDISFLPADMRYKPLGTLDLTSNRFITDVYGNSGDHRMNGFYVANGPHIKPGTRMSANIVDIAPTILYLFGKPIPRDMDGSLLREMIDESFLTTNKPVYTDQEYESSEIESFSEEDNEEVRERLRSLGYLG
ncbi:MAG: alkaline phosphatase family protein [Blastocatellia bacterium]|nr:alkaline phosphatase family protein [Blastocatellia bacterium]